MDIAAFIIGGFLIGVVIGTIYTLAITKPITDAYRAEADRWCKRAIENLEALVSERHKREMERDDDKNDADWWKK